MNLFEMMVENNYVVFCYLDCLSDEFKEKIDQYFLEIVKGKMRVEKDIAGNIEKEKKLYNECAKYIYLKTLPSAKLGIIAELLFHIIMRDVYSSNFISALPTIGHVDSYRQFYKGFDGVYLKDGRCWISEVKSADSRSKTNIYKNLDNLTKEKLILASNTIENEVNDMDNNRWQKAKDGILLQLSDAEERKLHCFELLDDSNCNNYNKIATAMVVKDVEVFDIEFLKSYINEMLDENVKNQRLLVICIRNKDLNIVFDYIKTKFGGVIND